MTKSITFQFERKIQDEIVLTRPLIRKTLKDVQDALRSGVIDGDHRRLTMNCVVDEQHGVNEKMRRTACGTNACIGGWAGIFLVGAERGSVVEELFNAMMEIDPKLDTLFNQYDGCDDDGNEWDYDDPLIAAAAIQNYLDGKKDEKIWRALKPMKPIAPPRHLAKRFGIKKKAKKQVEGRL